jgi:GGDEF domain-containing protein
VVIVGLRLGVRWRRAPQTGHPARMWLGDRWAGRTRPESAAIIARRCGGSIPLPRGTTWRRLRSTAEEQLDDRLGRPGCHHAGSDDLHVTVSIGGTIAEPDDTAETVFARADAALYRAKREGRDRVCIDRR